ncbi:GINS complex, PSF2 component [Trichodelitschia bisporula]|uniref:DNA replication complex GINS protein PSF2 n=1 Tax=Trichodelitschia bisporula TaxID=703511 RepID=A0A6G1HT07_9PEZI|nr:GINS complex, PSF2 component [Trichodelitschia bisporula]
MAHPSPPGLTPSEVSFLCEMELVTVIPRQKQDAYTLLGGPTPPLTPPLRANLPLWLALLLKRQKRANIAPPPWLAPAALSTILESETTEYPAAFTPGPALPPAPPSLRDEAASPPFVPTSVVGAADTALPYHWLEMGEILLAGAGDDFEEPDAVRRLLRDLREVRMAKVRAGVEVLDAGGGVKMNGVGGMEIAEGRAFIGGVVDGLRKIGASKEAVRREREREERRVGYRGQEDEEDMDDLQ